MNISKKIFFVLSIFLISFFSINTLVYATNTEDINTIIQLYFIEEKENLLNNNSIIKLNEIISNENLITDLQWKFKFFHHWNKKFNRNFSKFDYDLKFLDCTIDENLAKVYLTKNIYCSFNNNHKFKSLNEEYIFILNFSCNKWKISNLIFKEENEDFFSSLKTTKPHTNERAIIYEKKWEELFENLNFLYENFQKNNLSSFSYERTKNYNSLLAIHYAQNFALSYNNNFKNFDNSGGDCTNFVSQCLFAGGIPQKNSWRPYNTAWINVVALHDYLIYNSLAKDSTVLTNEILGCPIQFYNDNLGRFSHSGFITSKLEGNDYGYCAHSYNKLDYPLSLSYPLIYKKIRILKIIY